jgi:CHAD domain-containing protein
VLGFANPQKLVRSKLDSVLSNIADIREGKPDAVHDARVATRRLRELLPLVLERDALADASQQFRCAGRALGVARELDVTLDLVRTIESRRKGASDAAAAMRADLERERLPTVRDLVKTLESLDLAGSAIGSSMKPVRGWQATLAGRLDRRAQSLRRAVDRAAGIRFPNRLHAVRIEAKKLRYLLEAARDLGRWNAAGAIETLKEAQDNLGELHDWQVLDDRLGARIEGATGAAATELRKLREAVEEEMRRRHARYLESRGPLARAARSAERAARVAGLRMPVARMAPGLAAGAAGLLALSPAARMLRRAG